VEQGGGSDMIGHPRPIEGEEMAVLMTAQIPGGTKEMIDGMRPVLNHITSAKGSSCTGMTRAPAAGG
jgi:hypothetical protein